MKDDIIVFITVGSLTDQLKQRLAIGRTYRGVGDLDINPMQRSLSST